MIREALDFFQQLCNTEHFQQVSKNHQSMTYLNTVNGSVRMIDLPASPINSTLMDIDSLVALLEVCNLEMASIFISQSEIMTVLDFKADNGQGNDYRCNRVKVPILHNSLFQTIERGISGPPKSVIRWLQYQISGSLITPTDLYARLSVLKFETAFEESLAIRPKDEGISRSMKAKVSGESELPDRAAISFRLYPDIDEQITDSTEVSIVVDIQIDPTEGKITIAPLPGEIRKAQRIALQAIQSELKKRIPALKNAVYLGSP